MKRSLCIGLAALAVALAPAPSTEQDAPPPPPQPNDPAGLARLRAEAGVKAFDLAWLYYSENRVDSEKVYRSSRRLLEAARDAATDGPGRVAAFEGHLERIGRLEAKIAKIRRLGFGNSLDVLEVDYYRKEAEFWLAEARAKEAGK
jgi:hypothetical protein